jgi:hypothetical protein
MQCESENPLSGVTLGFFPENLGVKDFTKTLCLWKSGTKASGPQLFWQTIAGN